MSASVVDDLAERAERLRGYPPSFTPYALARALLACDIEYDRAVREGEWKRAAEIGYLTATLARVSAPE
jgi:hypothetical protein